MKRVTAIATATVLALLIALTFNVAAQQSDTRDRTIMTFSSAVELPGMRLEPGMYVFRIADTESRNVIQVLDQSETNVMGQWLFIPAERPEVTGDTVVTFRETSAASTPAVQYWYYPGERIGKEFIYPKDQALRIAQRTGATVQTEQGPVSEGAQASVYDDIQGKEPTSASSVEPQGSGVVKGDGLPDSQAETTVATSGSARQSEAVGTAGTADQTPAATDSNVRQESTRAQNETTYAERELPATASPIPLSGLLALLSLAGAAGIRSFRVK